MAIPIDENNETGSTDAALRDQITSLSKGLDVYSRKVGAYQSNLFFYELEMDKLRKSFWKRLRLLFNPSMITPPGIPSEAQFWL